MLIVSGDKLFARMLKIALENAGFSDVEITATPRSVYPESIVDLSVDPAPAPSENVITVSSGKLPADFIRPFLLSDFLRSVSERFGSKQTSHPLPTLVPGISRDRIQFTHDGVTVSDFRISLSAKEREMLEILAGSDEPVPEEELRRAVFPDKQSNVVPVYISYLRKKLEDAPGHPVIRAIRGKGYTIRWL